MTESIDDAFLRFQRSGAPDAIARREVALALGRPARAVRTLLDLRAGVTRRLETHVCGLRPGRPRGRIMGSGERPARSDAQGSIDVALLPGRYRATISLGSDQRILLPQWVDITAGGIIDQDLHVRHVRLVLRILDDQGAPVVGRVFTLRSTTDSHLHQSSHTTDAGGELVLDPAPLSPFELLTWPGSLMAPELRAALVTQGQEAIERTWIRLGPLVAPADASEQTVELRFVDR